jgi:hypothetical protein
MKINDGTNWQEGKELKIYTGSSWSSAKKAFVFVDGAWKIMYPNLPERVASTTPIFQYSGTTYAAVGSVFAFNISWNMDPAYAPTSYTYQWKRNNVNISGATSQTYTATEQDLDKILSATVVATNDRGSTTVSESSGLTILPELPLMLAYEITDTPSQPSVSISKNALAYSGSWTSSTNATDYTITTNNGSVSKSGQTFSGTGQPGQVTVTVTPVNTNKKVYIVWNSAPGASSYDIVKYGNDGTTTVNVSSSTNTYTWNIATGNENNYFTVYPKSPAGMQGYGIQKLATTSNKTGTPGTATATLGCTAGWVDADWTYGGATWSGSCVNNSESGSYSWRYRLYRYADCTEDNIMEYGTYATSRYCVPTCTAAWVDADYTYSAVTWNGTCSSDGIEGGTSASRSRTYRYADCSTAVLTELGPFYRTRSCTPCVCNYSTGGQYQSYHFAPECCPGGSARAGSLSGTTVNNCCPNVSKTITKWDCKSYDVTNSASSNYSTCYYVGECAANTNSDGSRAQCWLPA